MVQATSHLPTQVSSTLYVEVIDTEGVITDSLTLYIDRGTANGSFKLDKTLNPGSYTIRAYTQWLRNFDPSLFYMKGFMLVNPSLGKGAKSNEINQSKLFVDFLPEGGDLIGGIASKLAIRSTDQHSNGESANGIIVNQTGEQITTFETNIQGYGLIFLTPIQGDSYYALTEQTKLDLPKVKNIGAVIRATHSHTSNKVMISVLAKNVDLSGGTLVMHKRGQFLLSQDCHNKNALAVSINKSDLGSGIISVTFFDKNQVPLTERLILPNPPSNDPTINIQSDKNNYNKRSKVSLSLSLKKDTILSASITVNPKTESSYHEYGENIENYLLLTSDLKGKIETPNYYFQESKEAYMALDLVMLTHGWSRFDWHSLLDESWGFSPVFLPEEGLKIVGKASNFYNDKSLKEASLGVSIPSIGILNETVPLGEDGAFQIDGFRLMDSTNIYLQVYENKKGKAVNYRNVDIHITSTSRPCIENSMSQPADLNFEYLEKANKLEQISKLYFLDENIKELDEVVVSASSLKKEEINRRTLYTNPTHRLMLDSIRHIQGARSVFDLLRDISGVIVTGTFPFQSAHIRRANGPTLFMLDGVPTDDVLINSIPLQNVEFIDVLKGPSAAIYGSRGAGGLILVFTRLDSSGNIREINPEGFYAFLHPGYHQAKQFYNPNYDIPKEEHRIPDFRTTLYWNPDLKFENGKSEIVFYTSDQPGQLTIRLEGMLTNGKPFFEERMIYVD